MKPYRASCGSPAVTKAMSVLSMIGLILGCAYLGLTVRRIVLNLSMTYFSSGFDLFGYFYSYFIDAVVMIVLSAGILRLLKTGSSRGIPAAVVLFFVMALISLILSFVYWPAQAGTAAYLDIAVTLLFAAMMLVLYAYTQNRAGRGAAVPAVLLMIIPLVTDFLSLFRNLEGETSIVLICFYVISGLAAILEFALMLLMVTKFEVKAQG